MLPITKKISQVVTSNAEINNLILTTMTMQVKVKEPADYIEPCLPTKDGDCEVSVT